jgi:glutamyl endopeptidase
VVRPSDSPHLRTPDDLKNAEPITPYDGPPGPSIEDPRATITHDLVSGLTTVVPSSDLANRLVLPDNRIVEPFAGLAWPIGTQGERSVIGTDDRSRRTDTGSYPWRTVVRLGVRWTSTSGTGACSGAIISPYHVLTAGHCVFDYGGTDDWAFSIQVFPGLDDDEMPYNFAWATRYHSYTGWTDSGMTEHDWAVIALDRSVGNFTGWMGRQTDSSSSSIYTGTLNIAGYPGTPNGNATCPSWANCQYWDADSGHSASSDNHWYWMDTSGGMSGGPVWRYVSSSGSRYILTAHTCGTGGCGVNSNGVNHGTRLNNDKYDRIPTWISGDSDITPNDRADLIDDGPGFSGFSPTTVYDGQSFSAWSDVRNIGTASSGSFYVSYYASTNTTISTGDYLIGNDFMGSISPFNWADSNLSSIGFPSGIPDGTYYVGWIIDRFDAVPEFSNGNNTAYETSYQLTVCNRAPTPALVSPPNGAVTTDQTPFLDWSYVSQANSYRIQVDDSNTFSSPAVNTTTTTSSYTPASLAFDTYYWRVRADKACGTLGNWSAVRSFTVVDPHIFSDGFESGNTNAW